MALHWRADGGPTLVLAGLKGIEKSNLICMCKSMSYIEDPT